MQRVLGDDEATGMLREVAREADQFADQHTEALHHRAVRIKAALAQGFGLGWFFAPAADGARQLLQLVFGEPQRTRHIANRAACAIAGDDGGHRRALAAIAVVNVLDHFLATCTIEVDVDVRRLVALLGDEPLEQHVHARRIDFGDAQRKADSGVRRRAAALAEDVLLTGEADDIVDGEEIAGVFELGDQRELLLDQLARCFRYAFGPTFPRTVFGEYAQPTVRRVAAGNDLMRVAIAQFGQPELAAFGDAQGFAQQLPWIQPCQRVARTQMAFAIREQAITGLGHGAVQSGGGEHILQRATAAHMHVRVARRDRGQVEFRGGRLAGAQARVVVGSMVQLHRQPGALRETFGNPASVLMVDIGTRQPQREQSVGLAGKILAQQSILALG